MIDDNRGLNQWLLNESIWNSYWFSSDDILGIGGDLWRTPPLRVPVGHRGRTTAWEAASVPGGAVAGAMAFSMLSYELIPDIYYDQYIIHDVTRLVDYHE